MRARRRSSRKRSLLKRSGATYSSRSVPGAQPLGDGARLGRAERRVQPRGGDAQPLQVVDLVLHQRDERRDDQRDALEQERGELVAQRLAGAGREHRQRRAARATSASITSRCPGRNSLSPKRSRSRLSGTSTLRMIVVGSHITSFFSSRRPCVFESHVTSFFLSRRPAGRLPRATRPGPRWWEPLGRPYPLRPRFAGRAFPRGDRELPDSGMRPWTRCSAKR